MDYEVIFKKNKSERPGDWSLQEFSVVSKSKKREVFLDRFQQSFSIKDLTYHWGMSDKASQFFLDDDNEDIYGSLQNPTEHEGWERLEGNLISRGGSAYSMFGADRVVEFKLFITPGEQFKGSLYESGFDNTIHLSVILPQDEFSQIVEKLQSEVIEEGYLSFIANGGLYSEPSFMDYDPDIIKILTRKFVKDRLQIENEEDKNPPFLGGIRNFDYSFSSRTGLVKDSALHSVDYSWVNEKVDRIIRREAEYYKDDDGSSDESQASAVDEEIAKILKHKPKARLLEEMLFEVQSYCFKNNLDSEELEELSDKVIDLNRDMANAFQEDSWYDHRNNAEELSAFYQRKWSLWKHAHVDFRKIIDGEKRTFVEILDLKILVAEYLRLPIRSRMFSRILLDAMIYHETASYAETLLYASPLEKFAFGVEHKPLLRSHPLWRFTKSHLMTFIVLAVLPIGGLWVATEKLGIREEWPFWVGLGCMGLFTLNFALGVISLPYAWISEVKEKKRVAKLIEEMVAINTHIGVGEIISARFVLGQLEKTANKGAVWPSEIFPLLDDIIRRDGTI